MPLPAVPASLAGFDAAATVTAYTGMARQLLSRLQTRMTASAAVPAVAALAPAYNAVQLRWTNMAAQAAAPDLRAQLSMAVAATNGLEQSATAALPPAPAPAGAAAPMALGVAGLAAVQQAVHAAAGLPALLAGDPAAARIANIFGGPDQVDTVRSRVAAIVAALDAQLAATNPAAVGAVRGFVPDPSLPATMAALGRGSGPGAYVSISPASLVPGAMTAAALACTLVHEGSHILASNATVDFAYRNQGAFRQVPRDLTLLNAAHYEELAVQLLDPQPAVPVGGGAADVAAAALRSKVVRSWVRANDLAPAADGARADVAGLLGARAAQVGPAVAQLLFQDLFDSLNLMMPVVNGNLVIVFGAPAAPVLGGAAPTVTVAATPSPLTAARDAISQICQRSAAVGGTSLPPAALAAFIDGIQDYDRPPLRPLLARFYAGLDAPPRGAQG
jgi:hypothetical protein